MLKGHSQGAKWTLMTLLDTACVLLAAFASFISPLICTCCPVPSFKVNKWCWFHWLEPFPLPFISLLQWGEMKGNSLSSCWMLEPILLHSSRDSITDVYKWLCGVRVCALGFLLAPLSTLPVSANTDTLRFVSERICINKSPTWRATAVKCAAHLHMNHSNALLSHPIQLIQWSFCSFSFFLFLPFTSTWTHSASPCTSFTSLYSLNILSPASFSFFLSFFTYFYTQSWVQMTQSNRQIHFTIFVCTHD